MVTANEQKIFIYDPNLDSVSELASDSIGHPSGHSIFELGTNYVVVGTVEATADNYESYTIFLQLLDSDGKELSSNKITQSRHTKCFFSSGSWTGGGTAGSLCGSYYGAYSDGDKLYLLTSDAEDFVIIEVNNDLTYNKQILNTTLSDEALTDIAKGIYTELIKDGENMYFATSYGIYKIDQEDELTQPIVAKNYNLDFTSIIAKNGYIIAGGIENSQTSPRAWVTVFDRDFQIIKSVDIHEYFEIVASEKLSIVKSLAETSNGFIVGGMLSATPIAIEFKTNYNVATKTDGNGEVTVSSTKAYLRDEIQFEIKPNEGYKLKSITIVDTNGGKITFEDNKFLMPGADVVVEVAFEKELAVENLLKNPATSDIIFFFVLVVVVSGFMLWKYSRRVT